MCVTFTDASKCFCYICSTFCRQQWRLAVRQGASLLSLSLMWFYQPFCFRRYFASRVLSLFVLSTAKYRSPKHSVGAFESIWRCSWQRKCVWVELLVDVVLCRQLFRHQCRFGCTNCCQTGRNDGMFGLNSGDMTMSGTLSLYSLPIFLFFDSFNNRSEGHWQYQVNFSTSIDCTRTHRTTF